MGCGTDNKTTGASQFILFTVTNSGQNCLITTVTDGINITLTSFQESFSVVKVVTSIIPKSSYVYLAFPSYSCVVSFSDLTPCVLTELIPLPESNTFPHLPSKLTTSYKTRRFFAEFTRTQQCSISCVFLLSF